MTDQGKPEDAATTNLPTPPVPPPGAPIYQQPPQYQQPAAAPPAWAQTQQPPQGGPAWGQPQQPPPGAPGWGQPQPPQGPAWGQPQQPPPGAPGWGQPQPPPAQYWGQPGGVGEYRHGSSVLAIIAGIPLLLYGLLITLGGAGLLVVRSLVDNLVDQAGAEADVAKAIRDAIVVVAVIILICGILQILAAIGIWAHKGWGRALGILWGILGTLFGLAAFGGARTTVTLNGNTTSGEGGIAVALFILVPYAFVLVAMIIGGGHFRRKRIG